MEMKMICSYCKKSMGTKEAADTNDPRITISHGVCEECQKKIMKELEDM